MMQQIMQDDERAGARQQTPRRTKRPAADSSTAHEGMNMPDMDHSKMNMPDSQRKKRAATTPARTPATKPAAAKPADPHAGHQMPPAKAAPKKPASPKKDSMPGMDHSKMPGMGKP